MTSDSNGDARPAAVEVDHLSHRFKAHVAVDDVSFTVGHGSIHGFVGPNGAGKTTTLKVLSTLMPPQEGTVRVEGHDVRTATREVRKHVGFMPDHFSLYRTMTVKEYLEFFAAAYGLGVADRRKTVADIISLVDLEGRSDSILRGLSRGMQQRVSLARVLVNDPQVMLLDEPASGLDPRARIELMEILKELRTLGKTIFISSHILSELADLCDAVTIIDRGQVRYTGAMDTLLTKKEDERSYWIEIEHGSEEARWNTLRELPGVNSVDIDPQSMQARRVTIDGDRLAANEVLQKLLGAKQNIVTFREERHKLDDVFLELTEPGLR